MIEGPAEGPRVRSSVRLFLCGDVMTGRGIDQVLAHPGDPELREAYVRDARTYVALAEQASGPVPRPVDPAWPWGDALRVLDAAGPDVRVINLETAVTRSDDFARKGINYRMEPANLACVAAARPDICVLANNHVLDFGLAGLEETLEVLDRAGIGTVGAGLDAEEAWRPAALPLPGGGRLLVVAAALASSGVPPSWAATDDRPGVAFLAEPSTDAAAQVVARVQEGARPGDIVLASIHVGANWGHDVGRAVRRFAHALVEGGVDVVHGHSSHHPRPIEVHRGRLILYGCGDLINDYEGITGHEDYRGDLRLLYLPTLDVGTGALTDLRMVALRSERLRLVRAGEHDTGWLATTLDDHSRPLGVRVGLTRDGELAVSWREGVPVPPDLG